MGAREITEARGGDWCGSYGLVPGPQHSPRDRSLKVWEDGDRILVHSFAGDDWKVCRAHLGLDDDWEPTRRSPPRRSPPPPARPTARVRELLRTATTPDLVPDVVAYLRSRKLWPLPKGCSLKAHAAVQFWESTAEHPVCIGRFPAILAEVRDREGELVTLHVTYLENGQKLEGRTPRKLLSSTGGRVGCAVRLVPIRGPILMVAEGLETALAAHEVLKVPAWACLSAGPLGNFTPPPGLRALVVAADRDGAGLAAARKLRDRLDLPVEIRLPRLGDWAEDLGARP